MLTGGVYIAPARPGEAPRHNTTTLSGASGLSPLRLMLSRRAKPRVRALAHAPAVCNLAAVVAFWACGRGQPTYAAEPYSSLYAEPPAICTSAGDGTFQGEVSLRNPGREPLRLRRVRASCSCVHVLSFPSEVAPEGMGTIRIRALPERAGAFRHSLYVELCQPNGPERILEYQLSGTSQEAAPEALRRVAERVSTSLFAVRQATAHPALVSVSEVLAGSGPGRSLLLIDVRAPADFAKCRIPGSVNVPTPGLRASVAPAGRRTVLVSRGFLTPRLTEECERLGAESRAASAAILEGGLQAWAAAGGPLEGTDVVPEALVSISPREFYESRPVCAWRLLDISAVPEAESSLVLPGAELAPGTASPEDLQRALGHPDGAAKPVSVLVFNRAGDYGGLAVRGSPGPGRNVFLLEGGWQGYMDFLTAQTTFAARRGKVKTTAGGCRECP